MRARPDPDRIIRRRIYWTAIVVGCALNALYPAERWFGIMS